jgi:hypothetical protein
MAPQKTRQIKQIKYAKDSNNQHPGRPSSRETRRTTLRFMQHQGLRKDRRSNKRILLMMNRTHCAPPFVPAGGAAATTSFTSHMIERHRNPGHGHWKTMLDDWENEGGNGAVTDASQRSCPTDTETVARCRPVPPHHHSASDVVSEPSAASDAFTDAVGEIPRGRTCPECNSPADRVRRRPVDRLVSWISPVQRYRCRMTGWGCDWEGNLHTKQGSLPIR